MDIGAAGHLILFFSILVGLILVGLLVFSYAAYSFLVTLIDTAAGNDEVIWPGDPIQDWLFKVWYLGWVFAVWAVPASFLVSVFGLPRALFAAWVVAFLWLLFPVGLLSSLSAQTWLVVFRPVIVRSLFEHLGATLYFYVNSGLIVLVCGGLAYAAVFGVRPAALDQPVISLPLAAAAGAAGWLIYARLLGRVAHIISQPSPRPHRRRRQDESEDEEPVETFDPWTAPAEQKPRRVPPGGRPGLKPRQRTHLGGGQQVPPELPKKTLRTRRTERAHDPWAIPAQEPIVRKTKPTPSASVPEDPYGPAEGAYEIAAEETHLVPPAAYSSSPEDKVEGYAVSASSDEPSGKPPVVPEVSKLEEELAAPRRPPPVPDRPLVSGVYSFVYYPKTIGPCATLALGFFGVLGLTRILLSLFAF